MQPKFTFFFSVISRSIFIENPMVDPWIKWRKSKDRAKKLSKKRPYQYISKRVHTSGFVSHRTSTLPFLLKVPALLAIKLVCYWFLWLAKHIVKWWDMPSYLTQGRVPGVTLLYGIYRYMQPQRVRFSAVLAINSVWLTTSFSSRAPCFWTMGFNVTMLKDMCHHFVKGHGEIMLTL